MTYSFRTNGNFIDFVHTDNTSLLIESVLKSLHNTSNCVTWSLPEDTTRISFVIDDIRVDNFPLSEIDFDGTAINSQDDFETGIIAAFPGLAGGSSGSSYLVYTALITQSDTDPPTVDVVLENTLGEVPSYSYLSPGIYRISITSVTTDNCVPFISPKGDSTHDAKIYALSGAVDIRSTYNSTKGDGDLFKTPIEIRVYP